MANITMSVTKELHSKMQKHPEFKWSEVARQAIEERINDLEEMERIVSKSKLTEKDAKIIAKKIKAGMAKRFNEHSS